MKTFKWCPQMGAVRCLEFFPEPHVHINIRSIEADLTLPGCGAPTLHMAFHDLSDTAPEKFHDGLFKMEDAVSIVDFVEHATEDLILVNCEAGVSRSPGVVLALRRHYGGDTEEVFKKAIPNIFVTSILSRALREMAERKGR